MMRPATEAIVCLTPADFGSSGDSTHSTVSSHNLLRTQSAATATSSSIDSVESTLNRRYRIVDTIQPNVGPGASDGCTFVTIYVPAGPVQGRGSAVERTPRPRGEEKRCARSLRR